MRQNPHVRICGGPGSATTLVYPTVLTRWARLRPRRSSFQTTSTSPFRSARTQLSSPGRSSRTPDAKSW